MARIKAEFYKNQSCPDEHKFFLNGLMRAFWFTNGEIASKASIHYSLDFKGF